MKKLSLALLALASATAFAAPASEIWTAQCAKCHAADGSGKTKIGTKLKLRDYTDAKVQAEMTDEVIFKAIKEGITEGGKEKMKAYSDLSDDDIKALTAYIRAMKK